MGALALCLLTVGCSPDPLQEPPQPDASPDPSTSSTLEPNEQLAEDLGIENPPDVQVIREVDPDDQDRVIADCMTQAGFPATPEDGSYSYEIPGNQEPAFNEAWYVCHVQYPVNPVYLAPLTEDQHQMIYEHLRTTWLPCMQNLGLTIPPLPSLESYLADPGQDLTGDPMEFVRQLHAAVQDGRLDYENQYIEICPSRPALDDLYASQL